MTWLAEGLRNKLLSQVWLKLKKDQGIFHPCLVVTWFQEKIVIWLMKKIVRMKKILRSKLLMQVEKTILRKKFQPVKLFGRRLFKWNGKKIPAGDFGPGPKVQ